LLTPDADLGLMDAPAPGDWLSMFNEPGQTFDAFVASGAATFSTDRQTIYLQPLGGFPADASPDLEVLESYASAFFQMDVRMLAPVEIDSRELRTRLHPGTLRPQILTTAVLASLRERLPADAHCLIAVTMTDLYPADAWNFVFGQASLRDRIGVFSFARSDPGFFGESRPDDVATLILQRSAKTLVHEIAHTFGLRHCIFYQCVENGSNHQQESDRRPQHLCPVCLRKLQHATGLDLVERYRDLEFFHVKHDWAAEASWVHGQLAKLKPPVPEIAPPEPAPYVPKRVQPIPFMPLPLPSPVEFAPGYESARG
jgi:archaemetzincin